MKGTRVMVGATLNTSRPLALADTEHRLGEVRGMATTAREVVIMLL